MHHDLSWQRVTDIERRLRREARPEAPWVDREARRRRALATPVDLPPPGVPPAA